MKMKMWAVYDPKNESEPLRRFSKKRLVARAWRWLDRIKRKVSSNAKVVRVEMYFDETGRSA